jgi:MFS family permease
MKWASKFLSRYAFVGGNYLVLLISWILMDFAGPIPSTYSTLFYKELGASDFLLSVITFSGLFVLAFVQFPGGYLADKHGRRWLVVTMTFGVSLGYLFFVLAPSWQFIILGVIVQNFCLLYQPALFALMVDSLQPENRGAGFTLQSAVMNLVSVPAPLIAFYITLIFGFDLGMRLAFSIALITYVAAATLRLRLKETLPSNSARDRPSFFDAIRAYPQSVMESLRIWRDVPRSALFLFLAYAGVSSLVAGCNTYFLIYVTEVLGMTQLQWSIAMAFMWLSVAIPVILAGLRMDVVGRKRFLILSFLLYIPAMLIFVFANFYLLLVSFFFLGMAQILQSSSYQSLLGDLTPREMRGKVVGCSQFFAYLSQAFTALLIGLIYSYVSPQLPFILLAVGVVPMALIVFYRVSEAKAKEV